jgi:hypothetical protein
MQYGMEVENVKEYIVDHNKDITELLKVGDIITIILNENTNATTKFYMGSQKQIDILREYKHRPIKSIITKELLEFYEYDLLKN